jgi:hypothetical protein
MLELLSGAEGSIAAAYTSSHARNKDSFSKSKRSSHTSSTKSQLKKTNDTLLEMLQNLQTQLVAQTEAMLDMQSRIAKLESHSVTKIDTHTSRDSKLFNDIPAQINTKEDLTRETKKWWEACQEYGTKSDPPFNVTDFFRSPTRFSGFNFDFDLLKAAPRTMPPDIDDVPALTPTSETIEQAEVDTPGKRSLPPRLMRGRTIGMYHDAVSDIKEHVIEFDRIKIPAPPVLQTPPRSARSKVTTTYSRDDEITALPPMPALPAETPYRNPKGLRALFTYRTSSRSSKGEEGKGGRRSGSSLRF